MNQIEDLKKKKETLLYAKKKLGLTIISSITILTLLSGCGNTNNNNTIKETQVNSTEYIDETSKKTEVITENKTENGVKNTEYKENVTENKTEMTEKDEIIVKEFINEKDKLNTSYENDDKNTFSKKAKSYFINAVDFIFYDKEIKGIKYNELKEETKELLYEELCDTDEFIMSYIPNYKENISEKYELVKDFTSKVYYSSLNKIKELIGEEKYDKVKEIKDNLKEKAKDFKDSVSDKTKEYKKKLKDWYENYREN